MLRDVTERVVVASKGRFGRALSPKERRRDGLPHESTIGADDFMALTLDVWDVPPESAARVQHPAPFPVELPQKLMELYTYRGDLVVDPFCGSGTTLVAAARCGRDAVGYDLDPAYVDIALARLAGDEAVPPASASTSASVSDGDGARCGGWWRRDGGDDACPRGDRAGWVRRRPRRTVGCAASAWR